MSGWKNKVVLITGATSGIGAASAKAFAQQGSRVIITGLNEKVGTKIASKICGEFIQHDVSDCQSWESLFQYLRNQNVKLECLVNNAGIANYENLIEHDLEIWHRTIAVNQTGVFLGLRFAGAYMQVQGYGSIINIASLATTDNSIGTLAYTASKCAVIGMTKVAAKELGPFGVRVNAVSPGMVNTPMAERLDPNATGRKARSQRIPLLRPAEPEEIANAILLMAGNATSYCTGAVLNIDGGASC